MKKCDICKKEYSEERCPYCQEEDDYVLPALRNGGLKRAGYSINGYNIDEIKIRAYNISLKIIHIGFLAFLLLFALISFLPCVSTGWTSDGRGVSVWQFVKNFDAKKLVRPLIAIAVEAGIGALIAIWAIISYENRKKRIVRYSLSNKTSISESTLLAIIELLITIILLVTVCIFIANYNDYMGGLVKVGVAPVLWIVLCSVFIISLIVSMVVLAVAFLTLPQIMDSESPLYVYNYFISDIPKAATAICVVVLAIVALCIYFKPWDYYGHQKRVREISINMDASEVKKILGEPYRESEQSFEYFSPLFERKHKAYIEEVGEDEQLFKGEEYKEIKGTKYTHTEIRFIDGKVSQIIYDKNRLYTEDGDEKELVMKNIKVYDFYEKEIDCVSVVKDGDDYYLSQNLNNDNVYTADLINGGFVKTSFLAGAYDVEYEVRDGKIILSWWYEGDQSVELELLISEIDSMGVYRVSDEIDKITDFDLKNIESKITRLILPDGLTYFDCDSLDRCARLEYNEYSGCLYLGSENNPYLVLVKPQQNTIEECDVHQQTRVINRDAFVGCENLRTVSIPQTVNVIGENAFEGCELLETVSISDLAKWCKIAFRSELSNPCYYSGCLFANGQLITELVIPEDVDEISAYAFVGCNSIEKLIIGASVKKCGEKAFYHCEGIVYLDIGAHLIDSVYHGDIKSVIIRGGDEVSIDLDYSDEMEEISFVDVQNVRVYSSLGGARNLKKIHFASVQQIEFHAGLDEECEVYFKETDKWRAGDYWYSVWNPVDSEELSDPIVARNKLKEHKIWMRGGFFKFLWNALF